MSKEKLLTIPMMIMTILFCTGCSSMFFREGALIPDNSSISDTVKVTSLFEPGEGILEDVNEAGDMMLVFSNSQVPPITYNIEIYQKNNNGQWTVINFLNSEKPHISGIISSDNAGIYYTEAKNAGNSEDATAQLVWMSLDRKTTRVLSQENESIITDLYRISDGKVLCANDKHQILMMNNTGDKITRNINADYFINELAYDEENKQLYFTGNTEGSESLNLYVTNLNDHDLNPVQIDMNITSFDFNIINGKLLYKKNISSEKQLILYDCKSGQKNIMISTSVDQAILNEDATAILYSIPVNENNSRLQVIQKMDIKTKKSVQVTSPRSLSSLLYSRKQTIFSSVINENSDRSSLYDSKIFVLTYE